MPAVAPSSPPPRLRRCAVAALCAGLPGLALAQSADSVLITGSVVERAVADAPFAVTVIDRDTLRASGPQINLSEALVRVPGLVVANRSNYAQDLQISSRGFGARAGFGVRGIRLLADGIPATGPDGQGQVAQFDLAGAERVEVLRGPFSVLYGNSSGGVISLFTAPVKQAEAEGEVDLGSFGLRQLRAGVAAPLGGGFDLRASASAMSIDGFRDHSEAKRRLASARLGWQGASDRVVLSAGTWSQPAQDPLGLQRAQFDADPLSTAPEADQYDTRKDSSQQQVGASWKHRFAEGALRELNLMAYGGTRSVTQYLAIPASTQRRGTSHGGGVIDFDREFAGTELRLRWSWTGFDLQAGAAADTQRDARRGYENFTGDPETPTYGVIGVPRRDEADRARSRDAYVQGEWSLSERLLASAGVRTGRVRLSAEDHFLSNGDDSGARSFSYTNPVVGLRWQAAPGWTLHASAARGFESPTLNEVAYRADGASGLNTTLDPQRSHQFEVGSKWRGATFDADLALFQANVQDEIGVATNAGGRSAFQNVGPTRRRGAELSAGWRPDAAWRTRLALTWLDASYRDDFLTCAGVPCAAPTLPVPAGNRIAGTQRTSGFAELAWRSAAAGEFGLELRAAGRTAVNDVNSDFAAGYGLAALRWSLALPVAGATRAELLARVDNLFDRRYAGSVIVNESNGRFFEPGAPRNVLFALRLIGGL